MKNYYKIIQNIVIIILSLAIGLFVSVKSSDIINLKLAVAGYKDRNILSYAQFIVVFSVPLLMWICVFLFTIPSKNQVGRQFRLYTGIGFGIAIVAGGLLAGFVFLVRYV